MRQLALSAIGRDRPGIVAALTGALLEHEVNIEDSQATILRGHFTIVLILAAPDGVDLAALKHDLDQRARGMGLESMVLSEVNEASGGGEPPSHTLTVYGVDHPGIVHRAAVALAEAGANITDLNTRLVEDGADAPLYVLMVEIALPAEASIAALRSVLDELGRREGVEVSLRELEQDVL